VHRRPLFLRVVGANRRQQEWAADERRSKFHSSTTGSSRSPSELRMLHLIKPLDGAAGTVKPFRVSLVEPVAYPKPTYGADMTKSHSSLANFKIAARSRSRTYPCSTSRRAELRIRPTYSSRPG